MGKRVLIIDDEEHIRQMIRLTLETAGHETGEAGDGSQGLRVFGDGSKWDAVLLDQRMPGMDGLETLRHIKERAPGARVIMITAFASIELAVDAMKLGASDFVRKPMTPEIVRDAVAAALAKPASTAVAHATATEEGQEHPRSLIQYMTMNGFSYVLATDVEGSETDESNERRFVVKNPRGWEKKVVVEIDPEAVGYVERMTRRRLPPESSFWTAQATSLLSTYLWNEGKVPDSGRLTLRDIDRDDLPMAERWKDD
jgi:DNA-binding response OmpR family regulator